MSHRGEQNDNELQFKHFIEHLRSVELNLLLHQFLQGFYMGAAEVAGHQKPERGSVRRKGMLAWGGTGACRRNGKMAQGQGEQKSRGSSPGTKQRR